MRRGILALLALPVIAALAVLVWYVFWRMPVDAAPADPAALHRILLAVGVMVLGAAAAWLAVRRW